MKQTATRREPRVIDGEQCLRCSKCRDWKPLNQFFLDIRTPSGRQSHCRPCMNAYKTQRREKQAALMAAKRTEMAQKRLLNPNMGQVLLKVRKARQKPRKRIPVMSSQKRKWTDLYREKHEADPQIVTGYGLIFNMKGEPVVIQMTASKHKFERHHVGRRHRWLILWYRYVSPKLHEWIESNSAKARELGLLFSVECGHLRNPSDKDPLNCMEEFKALQDRYLFTTVLR